MPTREGEQLLEGLRAALARLADSRRQEPGDGAAAVCAVLDGAQLAARCSILLGRTDELRSELPGFVYLAVLSVSGEAEALRLAQRAAQLLTHD
jgi:hypothetical protein